MHRDGSKDTEVPFHLVIWAHSLAFPEREIVRESVASERGARRSDFKLRIVKTILEKGG